MEPMLAVPAGTTKTEIAEVMGLGWVLQQKLDGERLLIVGGQGQAVAYNRRGEQTMVAPFQVLAAVAELNITVALDGELVAGQFVAFDLPEAGGQVTVDTPLQVRLQVLETLLQSWAPGYRHSHGGQELPVRLAASAIDPDDKRKMLDQVAEARGEGWVAKRLDSKYRPGDRSRDWRKVKRIRDIDCVVEWINEDPDGKRNMGLTLYRDGVLVDGGYHTDGTRKGGVGECGRLTGDGARIQQGDVVTVQILNVSDKDRLYQPTRPRIRTDKAPEECVWEQLEPLRADKTLILEGV